MTKPAKDQLFAEAVSVERAAELANICPNTLYPFIHNGELPSFRIGRRRLIRPDALREFLKKLEHEQNAIVRGELR
jgi:excisionase family DNA binding protein